MKWDLDRRGNFVPRDGDWFKEGRSWRQDVACEQTTDVRAIGVWLSRSAVGPVADRRVAGDEQLLDSIGSVQTSNKRLQHKAARECASDG